MLTVSCLNALILQDDYVYTDLPFTSAKWLSFVIRWAIVVTCCCTHSASTLQESNEVHVCIEIRKVSLRVDQHKTSIVIPVLTLCT